MKKHLCVCFMEKPAWEHIHVVFKKGHLTTVKIRKIYRNCFNGMSYTLKKNFLMAAFNDTQFKFKNIWLYICG